MSAGGAGACADAEDAPGGAAPETPGKEAAADSAEAEAEGGGEEAAA